MEVQRTIRVRKCYSDLMKYLEYYARSELSITYAKLTDQIFNFSLNYLKSNGFLYNIESFEQRGVKGFHMEERTLERFDQYYKLVKELYIESGLRITKSEFAELIIYIAVHYSLPGCVKDNFKEDWGFIKFENK